MSLTGPGDGEFYPQDLHLTPGSVVEPILDAATSGNDFDLRELRLNPSRSLWASVRMICIDCGWCSVSSFNRPSGCRRVSLPELNPALIYQVMMLLDECAP